MTRQQLRPSLKRNCLGFNLRLMLLPPHWVELSTMQARFGKDATRSWPGYKVIRLNPATVLVVSNTAPALMSLSILVVPLAAPCLANNAFCGAKKSRMVRAAL